LEWMPYLLPKRHSQGGGEPPQKVRRKTTTGFGELESNSPFIKNMNFE